MSELTTDMPAITLPETPDIASSSDDYARRFAGSVGDYFLAEQYRHVVQGLQIVGTAPPATLLDVGGGHAQLSVPLIQSGYRVTVTGSDSTCRVRTDRQVGPDAYQFVTANLLALPFPDRSFDTVLAVRMMAHIENWPQFIAELCRVARNAVIVDYADRRSANMVSDLVFSWKKQLEGNTRRYACHSQREVVQAFESQQFRVRRVARQFFLPMAIHRGMRQAPLSRAAEKMASSLGLTHLFGSPAILIAQRRSETDRK